MKFNRVYICVCIILISSLRTHALCDQDDFSAKVSYSQLYLDLQRQIQVLQSQVSVLSQNTSLVNAPTLSDTSGTGYSIFSTGTACVSYSTSVSSSGTVSYDVSSGLLILTGAAGGITDLTLSLAINASGTLDATLYIFANVAYQGVGGVGPLQLKGFAYLTGTVDDEPFISALTSISRNIS